jgi:copper chaperone NosL
MKKSSGMLILFASLIMIAIYFVPVWSISLDAPQYPEGLGMKIWINKMTGDLQIINGLNHYIGMKTIQPDSIQELKVMPYILGVIILFGITVSLIRKKSLLLAWIIFMILAGITGGYDFWLWEYDYGHNLDTTAAIKVPGMNYQPPLIGSKQLLNFNASSMPDTGAFILFAAGIIAILVLIYEYKNSKKQNVKI